MLSEWNEQNFDEKIKTGIVLVDFWADWCGPCRMLAPIIQAVADEHPDISVAKVNVDANPNLADRFNIMSIPTLMFFKQGEYQDTMVGVVAKPVISAKLNTLKQA